jgi:MATE family multidrug resistance protein
MFGKEYIDNYRKTFTLAFPVVLSQLGHVLVGVADSIMVGRTGTVPLAAVSLGNGIFSVILVLGLGLSYGITPLVASADGKNDYEESSVVFRHGIIINSVAALLLLLVLYLSVPLIKYMNQPAEVAASAISYLRILLVSLIPLMLFQTFKQFAEGLSFTKQAMYISITANIINVLLNYVLIYGKMGFEPMGIEGAAIATLISRVIMAVAMIYYIYTSHRYKVYKLALSMAGYSRKVFMKILGIGVPVALQMVFEVGAFASAAIMIGWFGSSELAAHQIALSMASVTYMMASGISAAATVRVGNQFGRNDKHQLRLAGYSAFYIIIAFMFICALAFIVGRHFLPSLYIKDPLVIDMASSLLVIAAIFQLSDGVQVVGLGVLRGMSDVKIPTAITLVAYWVVGLPFGYFLSSYYELGAFGIWYGLLTGLSIAAIFLFYRFYHLSRKSISSQVA